MIAHAYVPNPWGKPICDAKIDDSGRVRLCGEKPESEVHEVMPEACGSPEAIVADAAEAYLAAHLAFVKVRGQDPQMTSDAARVLADAWIDMNQAIAVRREARGSEECPA